MRLVISLVVLAALGAIAALVALALGLPDVAATTPHWRVTEWALSTAMENGVRRRAADVAVPDDLDAPDRVRAGASDYDEMCVGCHEAPGVEADELARGLLPAPPELAETADEWSPAELFWITKHGVRMTGMAAFGPTHPDRKLWDLVAFMRQLPRMSPARYRALVGPSGETHHHHDEE